MQESSGVREAMARYFASFGERDHATADALITRGDVAIVVGTEPGEGHGDRDAWSAGWKSMVDSAPGLRIEPGPAPRAYEENGVGWLTDEPVVVMPDGSRMPTRITTVWRQEGGEWRMVHLHLSIGIPDEKLADVLTASPAPSR